MITFRLDAHINFEAPDLDTALKLLAAHFAAQSEEDSPLKMLPPSAMSLLRIDGQEEVLH